MSGTPTPLSVAFVESHPERAAQVLDALPVADSAAFLAAVPPRTGAAVMKHLRPQYAARCVEHMDERALTSLVATLGPQAAAALLQHLPTDFQSRVVERLPAGTALAVRLLLGYAQDTAGSCMDPLPLALPAETTAGDALSALKTHDGEPDGVVFVVGPGRRLSGIVSCAVLLRAVPTTSLATLMRRPAPCVSSLTSLALAREHREWLEMPVLAVIEGQDRLVGVLRRQAVEAALTRAAAPVAGTASTDPAAGLAGVFWEVLASLAQLTIGLAPTIPPVSRRREDGHER